MKNKSRAFTLIELLVVVLIIGILAAVAVPQYENAVLKSRYANLKILTEHIYQAQKLYYLANSQYAGTFEELGIQVGTKSSGGTFQALPWGYCTIEIADEYVYCKNTQIYMSYYIDLNTGKRFCLTYDQEKTDARKHKLCQTETGGTANSLGNYQYP